MNSTVITFHPVSHCEICGCAREKMSIEDWQILADYFATHNIEPYEAVRGLRVNTKTASYWHGGAITAELFGDGTGAREREMREWYYRHTGKHLTFRYLNGGGKAIICHTCRASY